MTDRQTNSGAALLQNGDGNLRCNQCTPPPKKKKKKEAKDFSNSYSEKYKFISFILTEKQSFFSLRKKKKANTGFLSFSNAGLGSKSLPSQ